MQTSPRDRLLNPVSWLVPALGGVIFSQAISFGWPSTRQPVFAAHVLATCVFLAGVALVLLGGFIRVTQGKLAGMEEELARMKSDLARLKTESLR